jgi:hypothetical protein
MKHIYCRVIASFYILEVFWKDIFDSKDGKAVEVILVLSAKVNKMSFRTFKDSKFQFFVQIEDFITANDAWQMIY